MPHEPQTVAVDIERVLSPIPDSVFQLNRAPPITADDVGRDATHTFWSEIDVVGK